MNDIVTRLETTQEHSAFTPEEFDKRRVPKEGLKFEMNVIVEPVEGTKFQKVAQLTNNLPGWGGWQIKCDEGTAGGGDDTAPSPLGYFSVGIALCLMTHMKQNIDTLGLDIRSVKIEQRIKYATTYNFTNLPPSENKASTDALETYIVIDTDEPDDKIQDLIKWSEQACFAANAFITAVPASTKIIKNGEVLG